MTEDQRRRFEQTDPESIWKIPAGSYFAVSRNSRGRLERIEVVDPKASGLLVWDFGSDGVPG